LHCINMVPGLTRRLFAGGSRLAQLLLLLALVVFASSPRPIQADTSLDLLPAITTPAGTDLYYCVQSATDYNCTLDQIRAWLSTGSFTTLSTTGNVGVGLTGPLNRLDVEGAAVIGATYSGSQTAPANGLLVEGNVSFGSAAPSTANHVSISDVGVEAQAAALYAGQSTANYNATMGLSFVHTDVNTDGGAYNKYGVVGLIQNASGGAVATTGSYTAARLEAYSRSASGTVASLRGVYTITGTSGAAAGTVTSAYGGYFQGVRVGGSTIGTAYGLYVTGLDATNVYGLRILSSTCVTNCFDIYAENAGSNNYLAGNTGLGTTAPTEKLDVNADTIRLRTARTPASSTEACAAGEIAWDSGFIYVCIAANTWRRATLAAW